MIQELLEQQYLNKNLCVKKYLLTYNQVDSSKAPESLNLKIEVLEKDLNFLNKTLVYPYKELSVDREELKSLRNFLFYELRLLKIQNILNVKVNLISREEIGTNELISEILTILESKTSHIIHKFDNSFVLITNSLDRTLRGILSEESLKFCINNGILVGHSQGHCTISPDCKECILEIRKTQLKKKIDLL